MTAPRQHAAAGPYRVERATNRAMFTEPRFRVTGPSLTKGSVTLTEEMADGLCRALNAAHAAGAEHGRREAEPLVSALERFVERAEWCAKSDLAYHAEAAMIFRERIDAARAALAAYRNGREG